MTLTMYIATLAWILLSSGLVARKQKALHVGLMMTAISLDIALVLYLQITRGAVQTALSFTLSPLEITHIAFSSCALLLYFPVLFLGFRLLRQSSAQLRRWHVRLALSAYIARTSGFLFMFSMYGKN